MDLLLGIANWEFYHNSLSAWLAAGGIFAGVVLALFASRRLLAQRVLTLARRTTTEVDDAFADLLGRTRLYFVVAVALVAASLVLELPPAVSAVVVTAAKVAVFLQVAAWGNGLISFWLRTYTARRAAIEGAGNTTIAAVAVFGRILLWMIVALLALDNLGYKITPLVTGLGVTGVAVALAVQNILGDLFAALAIVVDKPFVVGDAIGVDAVSGTVERIGLKTTHVRSDSGEQVIFSNTDILKSRIRNYRRMDERRVVLTTGVSYDTPPEMIARLPEVLRGIVEAQPNARFDRSHFRGFGDSALTLETVYYIRSPDYRIFMDTQQAVNLAILHRFTADGIEFAYPTRTVVLRREPEVRQ